MGKRKGTRADGEPGAQQGEQAEQNGINTIAAGANRRRNSRAAAAAAPAAKTKTKPQRQQATSSSGSDGGLEGTGSLGGQGQQGPQVVSPDDDVVEIEATDGDDLELQKALQLSLQEFQASPAARRQGQQQGAPPPAQQQQLLENLAQAVEPEGKQARAKQPIRGKRTQQPAKPASAPPNLEQEAGPEQQPQAAAPPAQPPASTAPQQVQQPQPVQQQQKAAPAAKRKKKLPAFNPSAAEVDACFVQLAAGGREVTVASLIEVGKALGQELERKQAENMMRLAASQVLGWGSGAGRSQGAKGALTLDEFHRVVEHFRVA